MLLLFAVAALLDRHSLSSWVAYLTPFHTSGLLALDSGVFFSLSVRRVRISLTVTRSESVWARTGQKNQNGKHSYEQDCHHDCLPSSRLFLRSLGCTGANAMHRSAPQLSLFLRPRMMLVSGSISAPGRRSPSV